MQKNGNQIIRSRPYHPQSQGKIERSHKFLKSKINFDIIKNKIEDWVKQLPVYQMLRNEQQHSSIGFSPFEIYHGRTSNRVGPTLQFAKSSVNQILLALLM